MGGSAALKFAKEGFKIAAMTRKAESFAPTEAKLKEAGATYGFYAMDGTDPGQVKAAFAAAEAELGPITVLVYNMGGGGFGKPVLEIDPATFVASFQASCVGALLCAQAVLPGMLARLSGDGHHRVLKKGTIIFSSATSAFRGSANMAEFACGKHALRALSQSIAKEHGKQGIHACHVRLDALLDTPGYVAKFPEMFAANKMASTDDIAETYYHVFEQSPLGWSNEIDIRPFQEGWSC
jgi:NAD(P)-dependent dehydrogenase (short-subunit alcohol dehydrogenase family)